MDGTTALISMSFVVKRQLRTLLQRDCHLLRLLIEIPGPVKYGHERGPESQKYYPKLISQTTAAPELLNNLVYSCALNKCDEQCTCAINEQPCTAACTCEASLPTGEDDDDDENVDGNVYVKCILQ